MDFFTIENLFTLLMLVVLQAVLGFDNLLYISIESKRVSADKQSYVRRVGIGLAIALRIAHCAALRADFRDQYVYCSDCQRALARCR